jgi:LAO/AO transport system kinase
MKDKKPSWHDGGPPDLFSTSLREGKEMAGPPPFVQKGPKFKKKKADHLSVDELKKGVLSGNRSLLAKAITLVESNAERHFRTAQELLQEVLPHTGDSIRIGITGVPGAGKSTFIEAFGSLLCGQGHSVAVLAVDPSSSISGGSILGDKTRMENLSRNPNAFIRPSAAGGKLGGVHRKTRETMLLCEAAGYDVIIVETVGVGQSEIIVREMVDFFMLLVLTGAGDELQGMKKGIMEIADAIIVNKADGANEPQALKTREEYSRIVHFLQPATKGWETKAHACSALTGKGIPEIWDDIESFKGSASQSGVLSQRRREQTKEWINSMIMDQLQYSFFQHPDVRKELPQMENEVISGGRTVASAVEHLFALFKEARK